MQTYLKGLFLFLVALTFPLLAHAKVNPSIVISPGYTSIGVSATLQYSATVTGLSSASVTWQVNGIAGGNSVFGTISPSGLYTAPATIPSVSVLIGALGSDKSTVSVTYVNIAPAGPAVLYLTPSVIPVGNYTLKVRGIGFQPGAMVSTPTGNLAVTFINSTTLTVAGYQRTAGSIVFQVKNPASLWGAGLAAAFASPQTISAPSLSLILGQTEQLIGDGAVSWAASVGTISSSGLYTAPATLPATKVVTITATGLIDSASVSINLLVPPPVVSPASTVVTLGQTLQFTAPGATSWTATYGSVTANGFYTAPLTLPANSADTITATSASGSGTAGISLLQPGPSITAVGTNNQLPLGSFTATVTGTNFGAGSVASLNGAPLTTVSSGTSLIISGFAGQSGVGSLTVSDSLGTSQPFTVQIGVPNALVGSAAARRFLEQAAFGPTPADASHVQTLGFQPWINEQFNMAQVSDYNSITEDEGGMPAHFLTNAVTNSDQLRQRVAMALGEIFVTSINKIIWNAPMVNYENMLLADAFGNYRQLMEDVTLSPAMGQYLDMGNNAMANPTTGSLANENYARELMQLFTIGTNMLNPDGTVQLDANGLPIPTYLQSTIAEFARVFTGWTYSPIAGAPPVWNSFYMGSGQLVAYAGEHDSGSKQLLGGYVAPAGQSPQQDLDGALDNIFNHPNVGPFVATQLIQHLVKSNPSPAYVARVAAAFANNGNNVRGDLKATITAVLLDPEARANDGGGHDAPGDGHLQEPALFIAGMVRAFGGQMNDQNYYGIEAANMGENLFNPPSVFNYYSPNFDVSGTALMGGEFQIFTPNNAIVRANEVWTLFNQYSNPVMSYGPGTAIDLTSYVALAASPATLINALDLTLTHGVMPAAMRSAITTAVTNDPNGPLHQAETACYLILTSNYYNVWH